MAGLQREIIKWMQGLDLSYSVKNVRKDFANGFLVAEMLSRYHSQEINMHSFDNGVGTKTKLDNWEQLMKFFKKKNVNITHEMIKNLIDNKPNAALPIIEIVYTFLTERKVKQVKAIHPPVVNVPSFARPTASQLKKDGGRTILLSISQQKVKKEKFNPTAKESSIEPNRSSENQVKEYQVKQSNAMINRRKDMRKNGSPKSNTLNSQNGSVVTSNNHRNLLSVIEELNSIVNICLEETDILSSYDQRQDLILNFFENIESVPSEYVEQIFKSITDRVGTFADAMIQQPKEFWKLFNILCIGFQSSSHGSQIFKELVSIFQLLGEALLQKDIKTTWELFDDYGVDKLIPFLKKNVLKREAVLKIMYSYCNNEVKVHKNVIKSLQEKLSSNDIFIQCLAVLVALEEDFSKELVDLYLYYSVLGISSASPTLRASGLAILATLVDNEGYDAALQMIPRLSIMVEDDWWEIQAQLIVVCSKLLMYTEVSNAESHPSMQICRLLLNVLNSGDHNTNLKAIALSYIAPILKTHVILTDTYVNLLLSLPEEDRVTLLEQPSSSVQVLQIGSSLPYHIVSIPFTWDSLSIAQTLMKQIKEEKIEHYEIQHYDIMNACVSTVGILSDRNDLIPWENLFLESQNYLYVGLCDEDLCDMASQLLVKFFQLLQEEALKSIPLLLKSIEVIYRPRGQTAHRCQEILPNFLINLYALGEPFTQTLEKLSSSFAEQHLAKTQLSDFLDFVSQQKH